MNDFTNLNHHHIALEFDKILCNLSKYANSALGKDACLNLLQIHQAPQIKYELELVDIAKKIIDNTNSYAPIYELIDIEEIFRNNFLSADEIISITENLKSARLTKNFILKNTKKEELIEIAKNLYIDKNLEDDIFETFDKELNVKDEASDTLKTLRASYKSVKNNLKESISELLQNKNFVENLQDNVVSTRDDRPVFQVKASSKNKVQGIVHDISSTNLTYFIEPSQIIHYSNKLKQLEIEIQAEIEKILEKLTHKLKAITKELTLNQAILTKIDVIFAKARYSIHLKGVSAEITDSKIIDIQAMKHPLLVEIKDEVIPNDISLGNDFHCILITGSNTGGKTVALKTVGLLILMTLFGLHIPALGAKIYPYENIFCDISTEQNLEQGISTYSAHIKNISDILNKINENSLVLLDELGSGTDPKEGGAIAKAILEFIANKNVQAIITTHIGELKTLKYENKYFENATVAFDIETLKPKYKLILGVSGMSNAIDISKQLGLNVEIINNAREIFKNINSNNLQIIQEIEKTNQNLLKKEAQTSQILSQTVTSQKEYTEKMKEFKLTKKKSLDNFKKKFQNQLDLARDEIKEIVAQIRKEKSLKVAMRSYDKLNKIESRIRDDFASTDEELAEKYKEINKNELKIGQTVLIKKLNQAVILNSLPDKKGNVEIKIGNISSKINLSKLALTDKKVTPQLKKIKVEFDNSTPLLSRLDLRGMRVIEAIEYLDDKLDKANLKGMNQITVIHGHGTGALKSAINKYLLDSPYVSKFRYGDETEGSDGVVIIDLL